MKRLLVFCSILFAATATAGDYNYYGGSIDTYDPVSGLYLRSISGKEEWGLSSKSGGNIVNLAIFDPTTGTTTLLFKDTTNVNIGVICFETGYEDGKIAFFGGSRALNNVGVAKREPRNKLLITIRGKDKQPTTLYVANRDGTNLKRLIAVPEGADWHIDVKNSKLRVVQQTGGGIKVDSVDW